MLLFVCCGVGVLFAVGQVGWFVVVVGLVGWFVYWLVVVCFVVIVVVVCFRCLVCGLLFALLVARLLVTCLLFDLFCWFVCLIIAYLALIVLCRVL